MAALSGSGRLRLLVLGSGAGGGVPQWNCRCRVCELAWSGDPRVKARTQFSVAATTDDEHWLVVNASPDLRQQIALCGALQPRGAPRHSPISGVVLLNADIDAIAGLLHLRERQAFDLWATPAVLAILAGNSVFRVLDETLVRRRAFAPDEIVQPGFGLAISAFPVPGKPPLYEEGDEVEIGGLAGTTIALEISVGARRCIVAPSCAAITPQLARRFAGADLIFFDGTAYTDDELITQGLSSKTAHRMGHLAMAGPSGSLAALRDVAIGQRVYVHLNNSNPVLIEGSPERRQVEAAGWIVAEDGMEFVLPCR